MNVGLTTTVHNSKHSHNSHRQHSHNSRGHGHSRGTVTAQSQHSHSHSTVKHTHSGQPSFQRLMSKLRSYRPWCQPTGSWQSPRPGSGPGPSPGPGPRACHPGTAAGSGAERPASAKQCQYDMALKIQQDAVSAIGGDGGRGGGGWSAGRLVGWSAVGLGAWGTRASACADINKGEGGGEREGTGTGRGRGRGEDGRRGGDMRSQRRKESPPPPPTASVTGVGGNRAWNCCAHSTPKANHPSKINRLRRRRRHQLSLQPTGVGYREPARQPRTHRPSFPGPRQDVGGSPRSPRSPTHPLTSLDFVRRAANIHPYQHGSDPVGTNLESPPPRGGRGPRGETPSPPRRVKVGGVWSGENVVYLCVRIHHHRGCRHGDAAPRRARRLC